MIVMPANATGIRVGYVARKYESAPSRLGHLFSPGSQTGPHSFMPYALDNGAYGAFMHKKPWDATAWMDLLSWAANSGHPPLWVLVPDCVGDREETLRLWRWHYSTAAAMRRPLAFAVQDNMEPKDVPPEAEVIFVGGSTEWKWSTLFMWCENFPRVHVGRVNGLRGLRLCARAGAESCDGTGFGRAIRQWKELEWFLAEQAGEHPAEVNGSWFSESMIDGTDDECLSSVTASLGRPGDTVDKPTQGGDGVGGV